MSIGPHIDASPSPIHNSLSKMWPTNVYKNVGLFVVAIASSWLCRTVFYRSLDFVITIMEDFDKASSSLSTGRLSLDLGRFFYTTTDSSNETSPLCSFGHLFFSYNGSFGALISSIGFIFLLIIWVLQSHEYLDASFASFLFQFFGC